MGISVRDRPIVRIRYLVEKRSLPQTIPLLSGCFVALPGVSGTGYKLSFHCISVKRTFTLSEIRYGWTSLSVYSFVNNMSLTRNILCSIALTLFCAVEIACAQNVGNGIDGTWIIAPWPHDLVIDDGLAAGEYPVLSISETGGVRAYRFGVNCGFDNMNADNSEAELSYEKKRCIDSFSVRQIDLGDSPATLVFEGQFVQENMSTWRLDSPDKSHLHSSIQSVNMQLAHTDRIPFAYFHFYHLLNNNLVLNHKRGTLTIQSTDGKWQADFTRVSKENLADAGATLWHIFAPFREYFRCILNIYSNQNNNTAQLDAELIELRHIVREYARATNVMDDIRFKMEVANKNDKHELNDTFTKAAILRHELDAKLSNTPAFLASEQHRLGRYLNCGERNHQ